MINQFNLRIGVKTWHESMETIIFETGLLASQGGSLTPFILLWPLAISNSPSGLIFPSQETLIGAAQTRAPAIARLNSLPDWLLSCLPKLE